MIDLSICCGVLFYCVFRCVSIHSQSVNDNIRSANHDVYWSYRVTIEGHRKFGKYTWDVPAEYIDVFILVCKDKQFQYEQNVNRITVIYE